MRGPEAALARLTELAAGRDAVLAPEAARAVFEIAALVTPDALERREAELDEIAEVVVALRALAENDAARPDVRAAARAAAHLLSVSSVRSTVGGEASEHGQLFDA